MTARLFLIPSIHTALACIEEEVRLRKSENPLAAVTIVVPDADSRRFVQRTLGSQANTYVVPFRQLARAILSEQDVRPQIFDQLTMRRLIRSLLEDLADRGQLSTFHSIMDKPGFIRNLESWLQEAKEWGLRPADYAEFARKTGRGRDRQLADLFASYQRYLEEKNLEDDAGISIRARDTLVNRSNRIGERLKQVHILGFDRFTPVQLSILAQLAERTSVLDIYLLWDTGQPSQSLALSQLRKTRKKIEDILGRSGSFIERKEAVPAALEHIQHGLFGLRHETTRPVEVEEPPDMVAVAAPSREMEVRWALRRIKQLQLQGVPAADIAILAPKIDVYRPLVYAIAREYGTAVNLKNPLAETPAAAALISLLELASEYPWRETMDALRSPYFSNPWLSEEQIDQLEQLTRERPVIKGWEQWRSALQPIEQKGSSALAAEMPASELKAIELGLKAFFDHLGPGARRSYQKWSEWIHHTILGVAGLPTEDDTLSAEPLPNLNMIGCCREGTLADADLAVIEEISNNLEQLVGAAINVPAATNLPAAEAPGGSKVSWEQFRPDFLESLRDATFSPPSSQEGVLFRTLPAARGISIPHLFVMGLAEGEFPGKQEADVLYDAGERSAPGFPLEPPQPGEDACLWWQVICSVQKTLFLLRPWIDENGAQWLPSPYYTALLELTPGFVEEKVPVEKLPSLDEAASFSEMMAVMASAGAESAPLEISSQWDAIQRARQVLALRRGWEPPGKFEGVFQSLDLVDELGQRFGPKQSWSASNLNRYGNCPYGFFTEQILELQEISDPEEGFDAMQRGSLLHKVLESLFKQLSNKGLPPTRSNLERILDLLDKTCDGVFKDAPRKYQFRPTSLWEYEQEELRRLLRALVTWECETNGDEARYKPRHQELGFGFSWSKLPALPVYDSGGTEYSIRGVIDRIDIDDAGNARILDYKSGRGTIPKSDILRGLAFQTPLYALAAASHAREITQVTESAYLHIPLRKTSGELKFSGPVAEDETIQAVVDKAGVFVERVRSGIFPSAPGKPEAGSGLCRAQCGFAGICRVSRVTISKARQHFT